MNSCTNKFGVWISKKTHRFGYFALIEISVYNEESHSSGGCFVIDNSNAGIKAEETADVFWKRLKKEAKKLSDCERIFREVMGFSSDVYYMFLDYEEMNEKERIERMQGVG